MIVYFESNKETVTVQNGSAQTYGKCLPIWGNIRQRVRITDIAGSTLLTMSPVQTGTSLPISAAGLYIEMVEGQTVDLSAFYPIFSRYYENVAAMTLLIRQGTLSKLNTLTIPVINIPCVNLTTVADKNGTDFIDAVEPRSPIAHYMGDAFWIDSREAALSYTISYITRSGSSGTVSLKQGVELASAQQYRQVSFTPTYGKKITKIYPEVIPACSALTFRWLNSCGSFDFISCYNWSLQATMTQGLDGGTITKNEVSCQFDVTSANVYALDVLSRSPLVQVKGLEGANVLTNLRCTSTAGVKITASGSVSVATLKFQVV